MKKTPKTISEFNHGLRGLPRLAQSAIQNIWLVILIAGLMSGCGTEDEIDPGTTADMSVSGRSLQDDVFPLIAQSCGGCHSRTNAPFPPAVTNGVYYDDTDDVAALVGTFIIPQDADNSGFIAILTQDLAVGQGPTLMPPPGMGQSMSEEDINTIKSWINEGAQNN